MTVEHGSPSLQSPRRVIVLGGNGFIGNNLLSVLKREKVEFKSFSSKELDLTAESATEKLLSLLQPDDALVILSAITPDRGKDLRAMAKNISMGVFVGEALEKKKCAHVILVSSDAVYGDALSLIRESSPCDPDSLYGCGHIAREKILVEACKKQQIPLLRVRPCAVYGVGDTHNSYGPNRFLRQAVSEGTVTLFGEGEEKRDHISVLDLSELLRLALFRKTTGVLNFATGESHAFGTVAREICALLQNKATIRALPRQNPVTHKHFDTTLLQKAFPDFAFTALPRGIAELVKQSSV